jgi:hypothetical protein
MSELDSLAFLIVKAVVAFAASLPIFAFALVFAGFAADAPMPTLTQSYLILAAAFCVFSIPAFWPLRACFRALCAIDREVQRRDRAAGGAQKGPKA